jgi:hypothetical protein
MSNPACAAAARGRRTRRHLAESSPTAAAHQRRLGRHERALALVVQAEDFAFEHAAAGTGQLLEDFDTLRVTCERRDIT